MTGRWSVALAVPLVALAGFIVPAIAADGAASSGGAHLAPGPKSKNGAYRLHNANLSRRIIWGEECTLPDGTGLLFGGADQEANDGNPHTQIRQGAAWVPIHETLRKNNPLQEYRDHAWSVREMQKKAVAYARHVYFEGLPAVDETVKLKEKFVPAQNEAGRALSALLSALREKGVSFRGYEAEQSRLAVRYLEEAEKRIAAMGRLATVTPTHIREMSAVQIVVEKAAEALDAEPPPRALSPIAYDSQTKLFVIFGGDHLDYMTNDTWVFDPAQKRWFQRHPEKAPAPRANHLLKGAGDGKIAMSGGYHYASAYWSFSHYRDAGDGDWIYDIAKDTWTGATGAPPDSRSYHSRVFHPDHFLDAPKPNATETSAMLKNIPTNTWVPFTPPKVPNGPRDWGTVVLDPDHDVLLWFAGGHSGHGGADVMHYHLATNRWELPAPVDIPLGEVGNSGPYPGGYNFNLRTWIPGHTYRTYGYDPASGKMLYVGRSHTHGKKPENQDTHFYWYDPEVGDWAGRARKPAGMYYGECYHDLTVCSAGRDFFCWTRAGKLFRYDAAKPAWQEVKLNGVLPGTACDGACMVYDSKRNRLLGIRTARLSAKYDGEVYSVDLKSFEVKPLTPEGKAVTNGLTYIREAAYDVENDVMLVVSTIPGTPDQVPIYDCARNAWVPMRLNGKSPIGPKFNVSLGLTYDAKRKVFWAVGRPGEVHVLRLDPKTGLRAGDKH